MRTSIQWILVVVLLTAACGERTTNHDGTTSGESSEAMPPAAVEAEADEAALEPPFTAEQIRDEWIEGFTVTMRRSTLDEIRIERWTVKTADADGVDIEYATVDEDGKMLGEPAVVRSTWDELRDHASFPAATARREWTTRETAFGALEGWLYRVPDEGSDAVNEFFFAASLPGAPVRLTTSEGGQKVFELEQIERSRPATR